MILEAFLLSRLSVLRNFYTKKQAACDCFLQTTVGLLKLLLRLPPPQVMPPFQRTFISLLQILFYHIIFITFRALFDVYGRSVQFERMWYIFMMIGFLFQFGKLYTTLTVRTHFTRPSVRRPCVMFVLLFFSSSHRIFPGCHPAILG